jgi:glucosamine kinase
LLIGVDGGGTKCRARITDAAGNVLGEATHKASANIATQQPDAALDVILAATREAAICAGVDVAELRNGFAGLGLAGAAVDSGRAGLLKLVGDGGHFRKVDIRTDAYVTWFGAHQGGDGAILILGTGSCGLAVVRGVEHYVSGGGPAVSDEASAQWIGREAMRRTLWASDGRAASTPLTEAILSRFENNPAALVAFGARADAAQFGGIAPLVLQYADDRDPLALELITQAAADASRMIGRLLDLGAPSVYLHGGLAGRLSAWLLPPIRSRLAERCDDGNVPLEGAILLARRAASASVRV